MSEFTNTRENRTSVRWQLLATVSAFALLGAIYGVDKACAEDGDRPLVWLELDGQYLQQENGVDAFAPPFLSASPFDGISHLNVEKGSQNEWDKGARLSFEPAGSDWVLALGVQYGKSSRSDVREGHPTTAHLTKYSGKHYTAYQNLSSQSSQSHFILDFQAGKDVGLGMFGNGGNSVVSLGVRYTQFDEHGHVGIKSQPTNLPSSYPFHKFYASFAAKRKFTGIGPSLSWDASAKLIGNSSAGNITFDWGLNGAVLFGRQRTQIHRQTTNVYHYLSGGFAGRQKFTYQYSTSPGRNKETTVPNLGGFAGVSWRYPNAKVSIGYRADMFFGAIDGGIDVAHRESRGFYGPFANVSVGVGG